MVDLNVNQLLLELGGGALIGALIGFAAKKLAKVIAVIIGIELALFRFLETKGYMSVNWDKLSGGIMKSGETAADASGSWLQAIMSTLSIGAGFTVGFMAGFKKA